VATVNADCLPENAVLAFIGGTLPPDERTAAENHIAVCSACADLLTWAAADHGTGTVRLPGHEGRPFIGALQPGGRVGRYVVLGAVGRGGMGEVYAAYHPDLDRRIAVKVVYGAGGPTDHRRVRLLREARAIARLSHPNVITVHDAGTFGDGVFIAMELIEGWTIDQWLRTEPRTWQRVLDVFVAAGRGLAAAHAAGVVHRDFKPQNVMVAKDGAVRVMDFGLARLASEDARDAVSADGDDASLPPVETLTKTGAVVGTPAYMSPEQFRREKPDALSDEFSFCVALHEALFGSRPIAARTDGLDDPMNDAPGPSATSTPGWLRAVVRRGAAPDRAQRYPSMAALLAALERGRTRTRRRASVVAAALAALVFTAGGWRLAHGNRFACAVPGDRIAAAWASDAADARRQSIHRAFTASGRATAETSWERTARVLDQYLVAWRAMYMQACEATHLRGEQSAEVLDLRMSCLNDNLDQVRSLGDALATADASAVSHAVMAAQDLTPVSRCADIALLKSAVPLPKDDRTLREVLRLRGALREVQTMVDIGDFAGVLKRTQALRPEVEATGYKPLLGELLNYLVIASAGIDADPSESEATLREAILLTEASRDDVSTARIASYLSYVAGYRLGHVKDAEFWTKFGHAILDRAGGDQTRLRSWLDGSLGGALARSGDFEGARKLMEQALLLREKSVGKEHADYATGLGDLAYVLARGGHPEEALAAATEGIDVFLKYGDPDALNLGLTYANQGEAYFALRKYADADTAFQNALQNLIKNVGRVHSETAFALHGLGEVRLVQGEPERAVHFFEDALTARKLPDTDPALVAESEFGLARALWESGRDRKKARSLATTALKTFRDERRRREQDAIETWLAHLTRS
jgi:tetratricopeptide (TPR) repeat protein